MTKASGTVYRYGSNERIERASVKATMGTQVSYFTTDDDGDFSFDLDPGTWTLVALDEASLPSKPKELDLMQDTTGIRIDLFRLQGTEDRAQGRYLWYGLLIAFGLLIALYVVLHLAFPRQPVPLSATLSTLVAQAQEQAARVEKTSGSAELVATVADIRTDVGIALAKSGELNATDKAVVTGLADEIEASVQADRKAEVLARLATLAQLVQAPPKPVVGLWDRDPWRFLEVLMWGLAGVLVYKIIITGWYLRTQRFYREGIVMHVAHIITTPLLVLVAVLLLSLATLSITLASGNQLTLDLSDPRILVAVSFLLGTSPWPLWNFVEDTAKRIAGRAE